MKYIIYALIERDKKIDEKHRVTIRKWAEIYNTDNYEKDLTIAMRLTSAKIIMITDNNEPIKLYVKDELKDMGTSIRILIPVELNINKIW